MEDDIFSPLPDDTLLDSLEVDADSKKIKTISSANSNLYIDQDINFDDELYF